MNPLQPIFKFVASVEASVGPGSPPFAPGIKTIAGALFLFLWIAWYSRLPAWPLDSLVVFFVGIAYIGILLVLFLIRLWRMRTPGGAMKFSHLVRWSVIWLLFYLAFTLMDGWGRHLGFDSSRADMDRLVQRARSSPQQYIELNQRVGIYRVSRISCEKDPLEKDWSCLISLPDADSDHGGFYYSPKSSVYDTYPGSMDLGGGWHTWRHYPT